ncbi:MAG: hypothetical protein J6U28_00970, partial [Bacteroidales bacterium]|nr:hypothetical protein [Bacteroidales bacterium]
GPMDTSSAKQDEVDIGRDGADGVGGTEPRPRGFPEREDKKKPARAGSAYKYRMACQVGHDADYWRVPFWAAAIMFSSAVM